MMIPKQIETDDNGTIRHNPLPLLPFHDMNLHKGIHFSLELIFVQLLILFKKL